MEFFKFNYTTDETVLEKGELINNIETSLWIERYQNPGEFSFTAKVSSGLRNFLPVGTLISHADTLEVMIVENHDIKETQQDDPTIVVTGRSFVSYFDNRIVGVNQARAGTTVTQYTLAADYTQDQVVQLINDHISTPTSANDALTNIVAETDVATTGVSVARTVEFGTLWDRVYELLLLEDLGIKTIRRNTFGVEGSSTQTIISVYRGVDRSASVLFSWKSGDLSSAEYLFTNKNNKNSALVLGQYIFVMVDLSETKYDRRIAIVDGSDIDGNLGETPTGGLLAAVTAAMTIRGQLALANQNQITIMQTDMSKTAKHQYRKDFNVGDLITLDGNYGQLEIFRIVEYAEIEDENGESGHPTLALPGV